LYRLKKSTGCRILTRYEAGTSLGKLVPGDGRGRMLPLHSVIRRQVPVSLLILSEIQVQALHDIVYHPLDLKGHERVIF